MALAPFFTRSHANGSIFEPFSSFPCNIFDPATDLAIFEKPESGHGRDGSGLPLSSRTKVDWIETPEAHVFKADMPGMKKEDIKVEVLDGKVLSISGERTKEKRKEMDSWRCVERSHGKFCRQFGLQENARVEEVSAKVEDGVLTVKVPKSQAEAQKVRSINVF